MKRADPVLRDRRAGLCGNCRHVKIVGRDERSTFYLCMRASNDPRFRKYPPTPVVSCSGFEPDAETRRALEPEPATRDR